MKINSGPYSENYLCFLVPTESGSATAKQNREVKRVTREYPNTHGDDKHHIQAVVFSERRQRKGLGKGTQGASALLNILVFFY